MDSEILRVFITVANKQSISKAANKLKSAQSNITTKIQQLEKKLDCKLFHRIPSGVILTKEGEKLYIHAINIVKSLDLAILDMKNVLFEQNLKVASTEANAIINIVDFLIKIHKDFPKIELELITNTTEDIKKMLNEYKIDIGFISGIPTEEEFIILNKIEEKMVLVESKNKDISNNIFLSFKKGCAYSLFAQEYFKTFNIQIDKKLEFASYETILGCIEASIGKSILPMRIIKKLKYEDRVNIVDLDKNYQIVPTCMICRKDNIPKIRTYLENFLFL